MSQHFHLGLSFYSMSFFKNQFSRFHKDLNIKSETQFSRNVHVSQILKYTATTAKQAL